MEYDYHQNGSARSKICCAAGKSVTVCDVSWRTLDIVTNDGYKMEIKFCDLDTFFYTIQELRKLKLKNI